MSPVSRYLPPLDIFDGRLEEGNKGLRKNGGDSSTTGGFDGLEVLQSTISSSFKSEDVEYSQCPTMDQLPTREHRARHQTVA